MKKKMSLELNLENLTETMGRPVFNVGTYNVMYLCVFKQSNKLSGWLRCDDGVCAKLTWLKLQ